MLGLTPTKKGQEEGHSGSYLIRNDALVGRPPALRLLPCIQVVSSNMAETGNLKERESGVKSELSSVSFLPAAAKPLESKPAAHLQPRASSGFTTAENLRMDFPRLLANGSASSLVPNKTAPLLFSSQHRHKHLILLRQKHYNLLLTYSTYMQSLFQQRFSRVSGLESAAEKL